MVSRVWDALEICFVEVYLFIMFVWCVWDKDSAFDGKGIYTVGDVVFVVAVLSAAS